MIFRNMSTDICGHIKEKKKIKHERILIEKMYFFAEKSDELNFE